MQYAELVWSCITHRDMRGQFIIIFRARMLFIKNVNERPFCVNIQAHVNYDKTKLNLFLVERTCKYKWSCLEYNNNSFILSFSCSPQ